LKLETVHWCFGGKNLPARVAGANGGTDVDGTLRPRAAGNGESAGGSRAPGNLVSRREVTVTTEIAANLPQGVSDQFRRIVTENSRTLKFTSHAFKKG
jgi:hypothetical protein